MRSSTSRERPRATRRGTFGLFGGSAVVLLSAVMLLVATLLTIAEFRQNQGIRRNADAADAVLNANVRILGQTQRELLRLQLVVASSETDPAVLDRHRGFVRQRLAEVRRTTHTRAFRQDAYFRDEFDRLVSEWESAVEPPLERLITMVGLDTEDDRDAVVGALTAIERGVNDITSWSENERRQVAGAAGANIRGLLTNSRWMLLGQMASLASIAVVLFVGGRRFMRVDRQRSAAARATAELNVRLRTLSEVAARTGNGVAITDPSGVTLWVNDAFSSLTGLGPDAVAGRLLWDLATRSTAEERARFEEALTAEDGSRWEMPLNAPDGETIWTSVEVQPVRDEQGELTNVIVMYTDITARRALEDNLRRSAKDAEEAAAAKSNFLATMSHEMRTPLNAVIAMNELLLLTNLTEQQREYARRAEEGGRLVLGLVNDVLTFSAVEAGGVEVERRDFVVSDLVSEVVELLDAQARERKVTVTHRVDPALPAVLRGDPARLRQVLLNLVGNGVKFSAGGSVEVAVDSLGEGPRGHHVAFVVTDDGIGIPADRIDRLFAPFTQVDASVSRVYGGTGLGLAVSKGLVEAMGGTIALDSVEGAGTTVRAEVWLGRGAGTDLRPAPPVLPPLGAARAMSVLLVEDDPVNQRVATLLLEKLGVNADLVENGDEAVEAVRKGGFDVVLMDIHMPVCDGITATLRIRTELPHDRQPRIVALTADVFDRERFLAAGMEGFLSKPMRLSELAEVLAEAARPPAAATDSEPPVSVADLAVSLGGAGETVIAATLAVFVAHAEQVLGRIGELRRSADFDGIVAEAADLRDAATAVTATRIARLAARMEDAAGLHDRHAVATIADDLRRAVAALAAWSDGPPAGA